MKSFHLEPSMVTMRGVFYPTGHMVLMFPSERDARNAEQLLERDGRGEAVSLLSPEVIRSEIARTAGGADDPLPSPGTEAETVRHFAELADAGHWALMVHAPTAAETEHVMQVLKDAKISYGQKYRHLVIEDLVT